MVEDTQDTQELREVPAGEILAKIEKGETVKFDHVIIRGDLDVCKLDLPKDNSKFIIRSLLRLRSSTIKGHINFENIQFSEEVDFVLSQIEGWADFSGVEFKKPARFLGFKIGGETYFTGAVFSDTVSFVKAEFSHDPYNMKAQFTGAKFNKASYFMGAKFSGDANFRDTQFNDNADFRDAQFCKGAGFIRSKFDKDANFVGSQFSGDTYFVEAQFDEILFMKARFDCEVLTFKNAKFGSPIGQEDACRRAKNVMERSGDRERAGYHFYREMEAKRNYKGILSKVHDPFGASNYQKIIRFIKYDVIEYVLIQGIFGYGVYPYRVIGTWLLVVLSLGVIYLIGHGVEKNNITLSWLEYFYFSIVTAATPGYGGYTPKPGFYTLLAGFEAIFGTFMWAAFIATFARKYMR